MEIKTIDASGKILGRVASEAAVLLRGKNLPSFRRDRLPMIEVHIENAGKLSITPKKLSGTSYARYSGYPGGLKFETLERLAVRRGYSEALRRAIRGMLPVNRSRAVLMRRITITE